jgi:putative nucleotidyltransferase with HDIG domain
VSGTGARLRGRGVGELPHLARRFVASVRARPPSDDDERWAVGWLSAAEAELWRSQAAVDRAHTIAVARRVLEACGGTGEDGAPVPRWQMAAALLHDVGKAEARLGVAGRTTATVLELVGVRRAPGRLGRYLHYTEVGAVRLAAVGADERVVAWAREHHRPPARWSAVVPDGEALVLAAADRG